MQFRNNHCQIRATLPERGHQTLSEDQVKALYPRAAPEHLAAFQAQADGLLQGYGTARKATRLQFFLAQMGHESAGLTRTEEDLNYRAERLLVIWPKRFPSLADAAPYARNPEKLAECVYGGRRDLGNKLPGDGWLFRGRGYIQLTGRITYAEVGAIAGLDLVNQPELVAGPDHALLVSCAFWEWKGLNKLCNTGDFEAVTRRVSGGLHGLQDRKAWLDKVRRVLATPPAPENQPAAELAVAVQRAPQARGYTEIGAADGDIGPRSIAAITRFRLAAGLPSGLIDKRLLKALEIAV
ncbi:MAG: glycoside hydrolase family 19 protein [Roseomonas sp.]|nr:glycoside hydrolase family 19 protein [Roseomonas sp.]